MGNELLSLINKKDDIVLEKGDKFSVRFNNGKYYVSYSFDSEINFAYTLIKIYGENINVSLDRNFKNLGCFLDMSRNAVMNMESLKKMIKIISCLGYTQLFLYIEDTYEVDNEPYFGYKRGRYTKKELKEIDDFAFSYGIEVIPCIQTLAHLQTLKMWTEYSGLFDASDILEVGNEKVYSLINNMFDSLKDVFRSKVIHVGMDEAFLLGKGKYFKDNGFVKQEDIFKSHLSRVYKLAKEKGISIKVWSDEFLNDKIEVEEDIEICYWNYYGKTPNDYQGDYDKLSKYNNKKSFFGTVYSHSGFFPQNTCGISYLESGLKCALDNNIEDVVITSWGDGGGLCPAFSSLPVFVYATKIVYNFDNFLLKDIFKYITDIEYDDFYSLEKMNLLTDDKFNRNNTPTYMLFNDYFLGLANSTVVFSDNEKFATLKKQYKKLCDNDFGYLFHTASVFAELLEYKYTLSNKTKDYYKDKDYVSLKKLVKNDYKKTLKLMIKLCNVYEKQWKTVNKSEGLEIFIMRIGGMIERTKYCIKTLKEFLNGKIDAISELEGETLGFLGDRENYVSKNEGYGSWANVYSPSTMSKDL